MTTMLEKVGARIEAAFAKQGGGYAPDTDWTEIARAALQAIREPDRAMIRAGVDGIDEVEGDCATEDGAAAGFTAMIDAILAEPNSTP